MHLSKGVLLRAATKKRGRSYINPHVCPLYTCIISSLPIHFNPTLSHAIVLQVTPEKKIIDDVKSADQWDKEAGLVAR